MSDFKPDRLQKEEKGEAVVEGVLHRSWSEARTKSAILQTVLFFLCGNYKVIERIFECRGVSHYALKSFFIQRYAHMRRRL